MFQNPVSRRTMLKTTASGFGYLAFAGISTWAAEKAANPLAPRKPHFPARAKHVIFLCMKGGPSHVDTFDYKPQLTAADGKPFSHGRFREAKLLGSPWKFAQHGQSGLWISELYPETAKHADLLCVVRSMQTDLPSHEQAFVQMHAGVFQAPRPSLGSWTLYAVRSCRRSIRARASAATSNPSPAPRSATSAIRCSPVRRSGRSWTICSN
jgi:hypothetical protein